MEAAVEGPAGSSSSSIVTCRGAGRLCRLSVIRSDPKASTRTSTQGLPSLLTDSLRAGELRHQNSLGRSGRRHHRPARGTRDCLTPAVLQTVCLQTSFSLDFVRMTMPCPVHFHRDALRPTPRSSLPFSPHDVRSLCISSMPTSVSKQSASQVDEFGSLDPLARPDSDESDSRSHSVSADESNDEKWHLRRRPSTSASRRRKQHAPKQSLRQQLSQSLASSKTDRDRKKTKDEDWRKAGYTRDDPLPVRPGFIVELLLLVLLGLRTRRLQVRLLNEDPQKVWTSFRGRSFWSPTGPAPHSQDQSQIA